MAGKSKRIYFLVLLLGMVFLAAQLHCCLELNSRTMDSHFCPICSTAGSVIVTPSTDITIIPSVDRVESAGVTIAVPPVVLRSIAPRAPPIA
jgi:hypothetical protein